MSRDNRQVFIPQLTGWAPATSGWRCSECGEISTRKLTNQHFNSRRHKNNILTAKFKAKNYVEVSRIFVESAYICSDGSMYSGPRRFSIQPSVNKMLAAFKHHGVEEDLDGFAWVPETNIAVHIKSWLANRYHSAYTESYNGNVPVAGIPNGPIKNKNPSLFKWLTDKTGKNFMTNSIDAEFGACMKCGEPATARYTFMSSNIKTNLCVKHGNQLAVLVDDFLSNS